MFEISKDCVGCHNCAMECPMQAINFVGLKYDIDQDKCIGCGRCAQVCHTGACHDTEAPGVPPHDPVHMNADVVVCGSGTGMIAAVRAAQAGKKVIVLEKAHKTGGNTDYAHMFVPIYTKWYEELGLEDIREQAVEHYLNITDHKLRRDVVEAAVYGDGEFFDWLCTLTDCREYFDLLDLSGFSLTDNFPIYGDYFLWFKKRYKDNLLCRDEAIGPGMAGTFIKYVMLDTIEREKLDVTIMLSTAARHLKLDASGKICGIIAEDGGGEIHIDCKSVILATGGFGKSDEKMQKYFRFFDHETQMHRFSVPGDTGDAIDMLEELGVAPDPERLATGRFGPKHHPFSNVLAELALDRTNIQVNLNGKRWVNEALGLDGMTDPLADQPKEVSYTIGNYAFYERIAKSLRAHPALMCTNPSLYETWFDELEEESRLDTPVKKADTLEELAVLCGMPENSLRETILRYNEFCAGGEDEDFQKPPMFLVPIDPDHGPYYAIYGQRFSEGAYGGLRVNGKCEVLREDDQTVIPGLYGVGDATSAMHRKGELAVISELTWATASAYISGGNAADYIDTVYAGKEA